MLIVTIILKCRSMLCYYSQVNKVLSSYTRPGEGLSHEATTLGTVKVNFLFLFNSNFTRLHNCDCEVHKYHLGSGMDL